MNYGIPLISQTRGITARVMGEGFKAQQGMDKKVTRKVLRWPPELLNAARFHGMRPDDFAAKLARKEV